MRLDPGGSGDERSGGPPQRDPGQHPSRGAAAHGQLAAAVRVLTLHALPAHAHRTRLLTHRPRTQTQVSTAQPPALPHSKSSSLTCSLHW